MKYVSLLIGILLLFSCSGPRVAYDYDTKKDFSSYKTYNYYPELNTNLSELDNKRLLAATDSLLVSKGLTKSNTPQLYFNFKSKEYQSPSNNRIGIGIGNGPFNIGGSVPFGAPNQHIVLTLDVIDVAKNELIWQAEVDDVQNSTYTPENRTNFFYVMMDKVLQKYPPHNKK